jgi:hypothetical protein
MPGAGIADAVDPGLRRNGYGLAMLSNPLMTPELVHRREH